LSPVWDHEYSGNQYGHELHNGHCFVTGMIEVRCRNRNFYQRGRIGYWWCCKQGIVWFCTCHSTTTYPTTTLELSLSSSIWRLLVTSQLDLHGSGDSHTSLDSVANRLGFNWWWIHFKDELMWYQFF
jgi:hypothetical protein